MLFPCRAYLQWKLFQKTLFKLGKRGTVKKQIHVLSQLLHDETDMWRYSQCLREYVTWNCLSCLVHLVEIGLIGSVAFLVNSGFSCKITLFPKCACFTSFIVTYVDCLTVSNINILLPMYTSVLKKYSRSTKLARISCIKCEKKVFSSFMLSVSLSKCSFFLIFCSFFGWL